MIQCLTYFCLDRSGWPPDVWLFVADSLSFYPSPSHPSVSHRNRLQLQPGRQRGRLWPVWCADPQLLTTRCASSPSCFYNLRSRLLFALERLFKDAFSHLCYDMPLSWKEKRTSTHLDDRRCAPLFADTKHGAWFNLPGATCEAASH